MEEKDIERTIETLHGDIRSIERQLDQRRIAREVALQFNTPHDDELYHDWHGKIRRAFSHKRDQLVALERELGKIRDGKADKKYIHVDLLLDIAVAANNHQADNTPDTKAELERLLDILDRAWPDWS